MHTIIHSVDPKVYEQDLNTVFCWKCISAVSLSLVCTLSKNAHYLKAQYLKCEE